MPPHPPCKKTQTHIHKKNSNRGRHYPTAHPIRAGSALRLASLPSLSHTVFIGLVQVQLKTEVQLLMVSIMDNFGTMIAK